jgi:hypothetical protein
MVCYARPVSMMTAIVLVVFVAFGKPTVHFFGTAALAVAVIVALAAAAVAAALVFAAAIPARRRRAAAGGCVTCQFHCQHAMTDQSVPAWPASTPSHVRAASRPGRPWPVNTPDHARAASRPGRPWPVSTAGHARAASGPDRPAGRVRAASGPGRPAAAGGPAGRTLLPIQSVAPRYVRDKKDLELVPRWPDRPAYRMAEPARQRAT